MSAAVDTLRPQAPVPQFRRIHRELCDRAQWVLWKYEYRGDRWTKVPYRTGGSRASSTDTATWTSAASAELAYSRGGFDGVGYVTSIGDGFVLIDLDHAIDADGVFADWASPIVSAAISEGAYVERSPSGTGLHIIGRGEQRAAGRKRHDAELYCGGRFFTMTGDVIAAPDGALGELRETVALVLERINGSAAVPAPSTAPAPSLVIPTPVSAPTDDALLERARRAANGAKFSRLFDSGDASGYPSRSEADAALAAMLAFWCGRDPERIERLMRCSALVRDKWDTRRGELTYLAQTVAHAVESITETYSAPTRIHQEKPAPVAAEPFVLLGLDPTRVLDPIPPERYLLPGLVPAEAYSLIAGALSSYKSTLLIYLLVWRATGYDLLGFDASGQGTDIGPAVLIFYEDPDWRVEHKIARVLQQGHRLIAETHGRRSASEFLERAAANLKRLPLTGRADATLVYRCDGTVLPNEPMIAALLAGVRKVATSDVLMGLDPLRLAIVGSQNDDDVGSVVVHTLNRTAAEIPGSGLVAASHTSKAGAMESGEGYTSAAYATSGTALFSQHARSNFHVSRLKPNEIRELFDVDGIPPEVIERQQVAQLTHGRLSHGAETGRMYVRMDSGVLLPMRPRAARSADDVLRDALAPIAACMDRLAAKGARVSETSVALDESVQRQLGKERRVRTILATLTDEGYLEFTGSTRDRAGNVTPLGRAQLRATNRHESSAGGL